MKKHQYKLDIPREKGAIVSLIPYSGEPDRLGYIWIGSDTSCFGTMEPAKAKKMALAILKMVSERKPR